MLHFSTLQRSSWYGRLLRLPLKLVPRGTVVRVLQGELRGAKWTVGSAVHGCWLGSFEGNKQVLIAQALHLGACAYDVGANAGFYTLVAARRVGPTGKVHAFEPLSENLRNLRRHITLNNLDNVCVHEFAVSASRGEARFAVGQSNSVGGLSPDGELVVQTRSIDDLVADGLEPPDLIKMDIEGGELDALRGAERTLVKHRPKLFISTHGPELHANTHAFLRGIGYDIIDQASLLDDENEIVAV